MGFIRVLIDKILGLRTTTILCVAFLIIGQLTVALGAYRNKFYLMQLGRLLFGLSDESLYVDERTYVVLWFKKTNVNVVFDQINIVAYSSGVLALARMQ